MNVGRDELGAVLDRVRKAGITPEDPNAILDTDLPIIEAGILSSLVGYPPGSMVYLMFAIGIELGKSGVTIGEA